MLQRDHNADCGIAADAGFQAQLDFAGAGAMSPPRPWEAIDFKLQPAQYMQAVLQSAITDNDPIQWQLGKHPVNGWVHAPWMAQDRDPFNGLTFERQSLKFELHPNQTQGHTNYAVGIYNAIAARAFAKMWADPADPSTVDFAMEPGAVAVKLLFSTAPDAEVPYLKGSISVDVCDDHVQRKARLAQVDIAVRDTDANSLTGWLFGTFIYSSDTATTFSWSDVHPFTLQWGNDKDVWPTGLHIPPDAFPATAAALPALSESWYDPFYRDRLWAWRVSKGVTPWTGLFGRSNGPIDNPVSSCLSCHNTAADFGHGSDELPFTRPAPAWVAEVLAGTAPRPELKSYFETRGADVPILQGTLALDYSLQAMKGILNFRAWAKCRGDNVQGDIAPYTGPKPKDLVAGSQECERFLQASGDVFADTLAPPPDDNSVMSSEAPPGDLMDDLVFGGRDTQLPMDQRSARE
ncbi:MAG: hypothetical protein HY834_20475 [Devosia nanyangense]|uniref:Cytochrome c domain-containing protein n=1 Tax=Devosia nanyangense TaxID=1228055 RepID=A0A933L554_9HYPH|nr:hypothetical protein [Devosia nanyangense]